MAVKRPGGLGRGLNALFEDTLLNDEVSVDENDADEKNSSVSADAINYLDIDIIRPNASQPRKTFDESKIDDLAESIRLHGLIQPIIVRPYGDAYEIVAGERRWRAARKADLKKIPSLVRELSDTENMLLAIIENMQREDLNPIEEAMAFRAMTDQYGLTQEEVSKSVGKSRPYITNAMRLLKLPELVIEMVKEGRLSGGHARAIAGVENELRQIELANLACDGKLSVRALEKLIADTVDPEDRKKPKKKEKTAEMISVENELKDIFGTKVMLPASASKGKIEISFTSEEEFARLVGMLKSLKM